MAYKYHYVIYQSGVVYDYAQDKFMLHTTMNWLLEKLGFERYKNYSFKKKRISKEEWKARYC